VLLNRVASVTIFVPVAAMPAPATPRPAPPPPQPVDFLYTAIGAIASIPLSRAAPPAHRFLPLLVLGTMGGLLDYYATEARNAAAAAAAAKAPPQVPA
jgi:hypothetical protein